jgi:hypothetical protein
MTSYASELQDKIPNASDGEYLFYLSRYSSIEFHIGRINKQYDKCELQLKLILYHGIHEFHNHF